MIDFSRKLKSLRELNHWTQEELANRLGVSRSKIGNYEQGIREPGFEDLEAIADIFNCPISYLIEDDISNPAQRDLLLKLGQDEEAKELLELFMDSDPRDRQAALLFLKSLKRKL